MFRIGRIAEEQLPEDIHEVAKPQSKHIVADGDELYVGQINAGIELPNIAFKMVANKPTHEQLRHERRQPVVSIVVDIKEYVLHIEYLRIDKTKCTKIEDSGRTVPGTIQTTDIAKQSITVGRPTAD